MTDPGDTREDAFVAKLSPAGIAFIYSTYLGGASTDFGQAIAVDGNESAYVTGYTGSSDFPITTGAFQDAIVSNPEAFVTRIDTSIPPKKVTGLALTALTTPVRVQLDWTDVDGETGYYLYRKEGDGSYVFLKGLGADVTTYVDTYKIKTGTHYSYKLRAKNAFGFGPYSDEQSLDTPAPPAVPSNVAATPASNPTRVILTWDDVSGETAYYVYRRIGFGSLSFRGSVGADVTTFTDTSVTKGTTYYYALRSHNDAGSSAQSFPAVKVIP
jgi:fibronectin type 3 domain-containing protein